MNKFIKASLALCSLIIFILFYKEIFGHFFPREFKMQNNQEINISFPDHSDYDCIYYIKSEKSTDLDISKFDESNIIIMDGSKKIIPLRDYKYTEQKNAIFFEIDDCSENKKISIELQLNTRDLDNQNFIIKQNRHCLLKNCTAHATKIWTYILLIFFPLALILNIAAIEKYKSSKIFFWLVIFILLFTVNSILVYWFFQAFISFK